MVRRIWAAGVAGDVPPCHLRNRRCGRRDRNRSTGKDRHLKPMRQLTRYVHLGDSIFSKAKFLLLGIWPATESSATKGLRFCIRFCSYVFPTLWVRPALISGWQVLLCPGDYSHRAIFDEVFLCNNYDLRLVTFEPDVIIDCGAHIGLFTLLAKYRFQSTRCVAFEPLQGNVEVLRRQLAENALDVEVISAAVSERTGIGTFTSNCSCDGRLVVGTDTASVTVEIPLVDLAQFILKSAATRLLLKLDVEGAEESLLPHILSSLPRQCAVFFETHFGDASWLKHAERLRVNGFTVNRLNSRGLYSDGYAFRDIAVSKVMME